MGWTLTAVAARAANAVGARRRWLDASTVDQAIERSRRPGSAQGDTVYARLFERRRAAAGPADRKSLEAARDSLVVDGFVIDKAAASGAPISAVAGLGARWDGLSEHARDMVRNPVGRHDEGPVAWGAVAAVQMDATTCGAAVLTMHAMLTDPFVALWVATGATVADYMPPEVLATEVAHRRGHTLDDRWRALQRTMHERVTSGALGPVPWPRRYGSPPWHMDNVLRCAGVRFRGALVNDAAGGDAPALLAHTAAAIRDGIPVPAYVSWDSSMGLDSVIPRHVVLFVGHRGENFLVYEPGSARLHSLAPSDLGGQARLPALGNWSRLAWLVLPTPRR